jgi:hypothetical protein
MRRAFARDLVPSRLIESIDTAKSATLFPGLTPAVHDPASVSLLSDPLVAVDAVRERMKVEPGPFEHPDHPDRNRAIAAIFRACW